MRYTTTLAALIAAAAAAKKERTFAVLGFHGDAPLTEGRVDPIVNPGGPAGHVHTFQGASGISMTSTGEDLKKSGCSSANIEGDMSAYWAPSMYFHDRANNKFEKVKLGYMKVYYFFEPTDDEVKAFPTGLQILAGDASRKDPPATAKNVLLNGKENPVQPVQFTCPRSDENKKSGPRLYPEGSKGLTAGMAVLRNETINNVKVEVESGEGVGFPGANCDGLYSPLRADIHFPSCYDPSKGLKDYKHNMAYPTEVDGKHNCPPGWIHVPHLFYELYWDTPKFAHRWTPGKDTQPFCLSNGDCKGYSLHADFLAAWDEPLLQRIIDTCNAGNRGMDNCSGTTFKDPRKHCTTPNPFPETIDGVLDNLPGNNAWYDFGAAGAGSGAADPKPSANPNPAPVPAAVESPKESPKPSANPDSSVKEIAKQGGGGAGAKAAVVGLTVTSFTTIISNPTPAPQVKAAQPDHVHNHNDVHKQSVKPKCTVGRPSRRHVHLHHS